MINVIWKDVKTLARVSLLCFVFQACSDSNSVGCSNENCPSSADLPANLIGRYDFIQFYISNGAQSQTSDTSVYTAIMTIRSDSSITDEINYPGDMQTYSGNILKIRRISETVFNLTTDLEDEINTDEFSMDGDTLVRTFHVTEDSKRYKPGTVERATYIKSK